MKLVITALLLSAAIGTARAEVVTQASLSGLESHIKSLASYGSTVNLLDLTPEFQDLGKGLAMMLQHNYNEKKGGNALVASRKGEGSRRLSAFTPPGCSNLGCGCPTSFPCYSLYKLFWELECPCKKVETAGSTSCQYDIVNGDSASWTETIGQGNTVTVQRASRCPVRLSDGQDVNTYACKSPGCRARFQSVACPNPCSSGKQILCVNPSDLQPFIPTTYQVLSSSPTSTSADPNHVQGCKPSVDSPCLATDCEARVQCPSSDPNACNTRSCKLDVKKKMCQYNPVWTGQSSSNPDPSITCTSTDWAAVSDTCAS